jgi:serine/threonine protein kinase
VKKGFNLLTKEKVAVKIVNFSLFTKKEKKSLKREIKILKQLEHPHIVKLYDVYEDEKKCYMIFEYVPGGELFDYMVKVGCLNENEARKFMRQILSAVEYCHSLLIVHRDLKPENLLLDGDLNIKITDFGLSSVIVPGKKFSASCGSLHYACPEILTGQKYIGPGTDIWSLGIILYCLVVGRQPWDGNTANEVLFNIQEEGINVPNTLSDACVDLISKMLRMSELDRIPISDILNHEWMNIGYEEKVPTYIKTCESVEKVDSDIIKQLKKIHILDDKEALIKDILNGEKTQGVAIYHLLLEKKKKKNIFNKIIKHKKFNLSSSVSNRNLLKSPRSRTTSIRNLSKTPRCRTPRLDLIHESHSEQNLSGSSDNYDEDRCKSAPGKIITEFTYLNDDVSYNENVIYVGKSCKEIDVIKGELIKAIEKNLVTYSEEDSPTLSCKYEVDNIALNFAIEIYPLSDKTEFGIKLVRAEGPDEIFKKMFRKLYDSIYE